MRPERVNSSSALSKLAESLPLGWMTGFNHSTSFPQMGCASTASRERIQLRLPSKVLISPLCATIRNGCARNQLGEVLVL